MHCPVKFSNKTCLTAIGILLSVHDFELANETVHLLTAQTNPRNTTAWPEARFNPLKLLQWLYQESCEPSAHSRFGLVSPLSALVKKCVQKIQQMAEFLVGFCERLRRG